MNRFAPLLVLPLLVVGLSAQPRTPAPEPAGISAAEVALVRSLVPPGAGEDQFASIPWQVKLWDARKLAATEGKPILLWEMDGHPLGCG